MTLDNKIINFDINRNNLFNLIAKQFDTNGARSFTFRLLKNSIPFDLTGLSVIVGGKKPDGKDVFNNCKVIDAKKGIVEVELTTQMQAEPGALSLELIILKGETRLSTIPLEVSVIKSVTGLENIVSTDEFGVLQDAIWKVEQVYTRQETDDKIWNMKNMGQDVKEAMTGGSVAVVGKDAVGTENIKDNSIRNSKVNQVSLEKVVNTLVDPLLFSIWNNKSHDDTILTTDNSVTLDKHSAGDMGVMSETIHIKNDFQYIYVSFEYMSNTDCSLWLFKENGDISTSLTSINASSNIFKTFTYKISKSLIDSKELNNGFKIAWCTGGEIRKFTIKNICINTNGLDINVSNELTNINGQRISSIDMGKVKNNMISVYDFVPWGSSSEDLDISSEYINFSTKTTGDKGVMSNTIDLTQLNYKNIYISFVAKSSSRIDLSLFNEAGSHVSSIGTIVTDEESTILGDKYKEITFSISKDRLKTLNLSERFRFVVAIHAIGSFSLKNVVVNTNGSKYDTLPEVIDDVNFRINNPNLNVTNIKNLKKTMFTGSNVITWGKADFRYDSHTDTINFSHSSSSGNTGFQTPPFAYTKRHHLRIQGEVTKLNSGALSLYIKGKKLSDGRDAFYTIQPINKVGKFDIEVNMKKVLLNREPIDMNSIQVLISNSGVVESTLKGYVIMNDYFDFDGDNLLDILKNLRYRHIRSIDNVFADIENPSQFLQWAGGSYTHTNNQIKFTFNNESGNGGVRTIGFTSKTNFVDIRGKMSSITKHSPDGLMQVYICGKRATDNKDMYLMIAQLTKPTDFKYTVDLNYHVVYNNLNLNEPVYVMFGSVGRVSATFEDIHIYENELSKVSLIGENLEDTLVNIDTEIKSIKANSPNTETNDNLLVSPNGKKFALLVSDNGVISTAPIIPNKVLFIGNSLLNGHGTFGMCATDSKNDYFHHIKEHLKTFNPNVTCNKIHGAVWEQAEVKSVANDWVTNTINTQDSDYDLVIVQLGDNVNNDARNELFKTTCKELLQAIRRHMPNARVAWAGEWYSRPNRQEIIERSCRETGSIFIDISDLNVIVNQSSLGTTITRDDGSTFEVVSTGVASHPGNKGMKAIADRIIEKLF